MKVNPDSQAFAAACENGKAFTTEWETGISTRAYIATAAMQGLLQPDAAATTIAAERIALLSLHYADALIDAINAETPAPAAQNKTWAASLRELRDEIESHTTAVGLEALDGAIRVLEGGAE